MPDVPQVRFLSLFVPHLEQSVAQYQAMLGVAPVQGSGNAVASHPFAARGPVVFQLGEVSLALYECDQQTTHPGDVGVGLTVSDAQVVNRFREQGGTVFPSSLSGDAQPLTIGMFPDRHFFEIVGPKPTP